MSSGSGSQSSSRFTRFGEKRKIGSDTAGYDEYVEGVEADETASLETPLKEDNMGFRLIQKMGWNSGTGLGKFEQGRVNPVPFELKEDHMGLGRWTMELELAQDATEKRRQLEAEKELSEDLMEQYRQQAEKEQKIADILYEMNKAFYCELCDRQYTKYSEFDNHINSYSHHHQQRLRDLKQYETGRRFGGHRNIPEEKEKMVAAQMVAIERAQMRARLERKKIRSGVAPAFKPIGGGSGSGEMTSKISDNNSREMGGQLGHASQETKSQEKIADKKLKLAKIGLKFYSAGTLVSIGDRIEKDTPLCKEPVPISESTQKPESSKSAAEEAMAKRLEKKKASYTTTWEREGSLSRHDKNIVPASPNVKSEPPPLMSRQRELIMEKSAENGNSSDDEDSDLTAKVFIKKTPTFKFKMAKKI